MIYWLYVNYRRFTTELAKVASHVTTVDFMESYIKMNEETNGHFNNIDFIAADVMQLELPKNK